LMHHIFRVCGASSAVCNMRRGMSSSHEPAEYTVKTPTRTGLAVIA
jgi:hypothetical protein